MNETCVRDSNPNYCAACNNLPADCGSSANFCLINPNYDPANPTMGGQYFCGISCNSPTACPNGYVCGGVVLLTAVVVVAVDRSREPG